MDVNKSKLESWANKLLDTGKRNNLINFKDTKSSTIEIVYPEVQSIFEKVESSSSFEIFDPKFEETENEAEAKTDEISDEESKKRFVSTYSPKIKKHNQVLVYSKATNPLATIKNIDKKAVTAIEENGVNVAYMVFGFIHWEEYAAPILLAPISFRNDSAITPYYIEMSEDDVIVNPTFNYKLNAEYGVTLPEYEEGDLATYLSRIEEIVKKLGWTVSAECKVGIFSFLKLNMYEDLVNNKEKILQNNNIQKLLGEISENDDFTAKEYKVENELIELHNVVDADSSQLEAIQMAKAGVSFVLQGPPGTGKSQTITNIIAECLSDNKKVLFVSEKLAALNVVYEKLKKADLEEFCLELHSYKANKKAFISELDRTLHLPHSTVSSKAESEIKKKVQAMKQLDTYADELHKTRPVINKSLYQLYDMLAACKDAKDVEFIIPEIEQKGEQYFDNVYKLLEEYPEYVPTIGEDYRKNCWYGYNNTDGTYQTVSQVKKHLENVVLSFETVVSTCKKVSDIYEIRIDSIEDAKAWVDILLLLYKSRFIVPMLLNKEVFQSSFSEIIKLANLSNGIISCRQYLEAYYESDIYELDGLWGYKKVSKQYTGVFSRIASREYKQLLEDLRLSRIDGKKPSYKDAVLAYKMLSEYQQKTEEFYQTAEILPITFGSEYKGIETNWGEVIPQLNSIKTLFDAGYDFGKLSTISEEAFDMQRGVFKQLYDLIDLAFSSSGASISFLAQSFDKEVMSVTTASLENVYKKVASCYNSMDLLENWIRFTGMLNALRSYGLGKILNIYIDNEVPAKAMAVTFKKEYLRQWIDHLIHTGDPALATFSRVTQDKAVQIFKQKDNTQFAISKVKIRSVLSKRRPSLDMIAQGSALAIILREAQKKRKQRSIRKILEDAGELVLEIKPCFLMSPLSVSTYLSSSKIDFDVVIFDEASQIFPQDAIGAIYRAKQVICVGDSKQMPPTNFFNAGIEAESEDVEDINDFESILDLCAASMPQVRLKWHYRSRYEQLIMFSNKNFYQNDLVTFPSSSLDKEGIGVDFHYIEDGHFDHTSRTNRREAEYVASLVFENFEKHPERSLGVVAFSISQQSLIERILLKRRQANPEFEEFFSKSRPEPFFIKNLETVQGDERDTIIFSVAYARDTQGRLVNRFGPINNAGGERRLNVAVTRAKMNVQLVTSIHGKDIDISNTSSVGVMMLREYLDYAENGYMALDRALSVNPFAEYDSEFERSVADYLKEQGYEVDIQIGCSGFKIDMGLRRPNSSDYVLAIECDGATYHASRNARDRDRLRQEVLERMGWNFYRIWSTDWFKNNAVEKKLLLEACERALHEGNEISGAGRKDSEEEVEAYEELVIPPHLAFKKYRVSEDERIIASSNNRMEVIKQIAENEAPISEEWLLKRIVPIFGKTKVTNVVRNDYEALMNNAVSNGLIRRNGFIYIAGNNKYEFRVPLDNSQKRDIKYISPEELAVGMLVFIRQNVTVNRYGLYQAIAKELGFARIGDSIYEHFDNALTLISGIVDIDGENISLKEVQG